MHDTDRGEYIAGLREFADLLDKHADLPLPTHGQIDWLLFGGDREHDLQKAMAATIVRRITGGFDKRRTEDLFRFATRLGGRQGLELQVVVSRDAVCERVVTGTREITKTVPDPAVEVPLVEVTETVEDVEWVCAPLLADSSEAVAS